MHSSGRLSQAAPVVCIRLSGLPAGQAKQYRRAMAPGQQRLLPPSGSDKALNGRYCALPFLEEISTGHTTTSSSKSLALSAGHTCLVGLQQPYVYTQWQLEAGSQRQVEEIIARAVVYPFRPNCRAPYISRPRAVWAKLRPRRGS